jgi:homogentisate 1,2-dioxygenase
MTMNVNTSPDIVNRAAVDITPGYMSGFGNSFETEALPRGRNSPQRWSAGRWRKTPFVRPGIT